MKLIILGDELDQSHNFEFPKSWMWIALGALAALVFTLLISIVALVHRGNKLELAEQDLQRMQQDLLFEQKQLDEFYTYSDAVFTEHAKQAGQLQARLARLEALGSRLADMADFDQEFDFTSRPAFGGPDTEQDGSHEHSEGEHTALSGKVSSADKVSLHHDVLLTIKNLSHSLNSREHELLAIESLLEDQQLNKEQYVAGKPVESGWLSSHYGKRIDPFHGKVAWHKGVDFAGKAGSKILAVASGVVVWSGKRYGFGRMVEIDHGNGFKTRYAHNRKNLVNIGEVVKKGQFIAEMGSSGRSTGPHVHFEVLKNGRAVDPARYIYRASL